MRTVHGWKKARPVLEGWRKKLLSLQVVLKQPRVIEIVPVDFSSGEPAGREGQQKKKFRAQLVYVTGDDATLRRPAGALLVIDTYELESLSDGTTRVLP